MRPLLFALFLVSSFVASPHARASSLTVTRSQATIAPTTYDNVIVTGTGVLTVDAALTVIANMTIQSGGVVTHTAGDTAGLQLNVTGTLDVQAGGQIDVTAKGLRGGSN